MAKAAPRTQYTVRVCPYYRLPQLRPRQTLDGDERRPLCIALEPAQRLHESQIVRLCRSGEFRSCPRFQIAEPRATARNAPMEPSLCRRLLSSALWVVGIPVAITMLILLAAWVTENVWLPSQAITLAGLW